MGKKWEKRGKRTPPLRTLGTPLMQAIMAYASTVGEREKWRALAIVHPKGSVRANQAWHAYYDTVPKAEAMLSTIDDMVQLLQVATTATQHNKKDRT